MTRIKSLLVASVSVAGLVGLSTPAFAAVTANPTENYVSGSGAPAATTGFGDATNVYTVDGTGTGFSSAFIPGNTITFTLSQGTFDVLPTGSLAGAGSITYVSGGAGQNFITYSLGAGTLSTDAISLTNVVVENVTGVVDLSTIAINITDGAGGLAGVLAASKRFNVAAFYDPYAVTFTPAASSSAQVDLGASAPGSRYTNSNVATLGTVTVTPNVIGALNAWNNSTIAANTSTSTLAVTLPGGPYNSVVLSGTCRTAPQTLAATSIVSNVATFTLNAAPATGGVACSASVAVNGPTSGSSLLAAGATSAVASLNLTPSTLLVGASRAFSGALAPISYAGGNVVNAGYSVGSDAAYSYFINVANGSTSGPVIVQASVGGNTGTAVLAPSLAANTSAIYSIETIRAALIAAGMPGGTTFADPSQRGNIAVVVPTGARVTPLLRNNSNTQVVEIQSEGNN